MRDWPMNPESLRALPIGASVRNHRDHVWTKDGRDVWACDCLDEDRQEFTTERLASELMAQGSVVERLS